jgi:hypothetical protein
LSAAFFELSPCASLFYDANPRNSRRTCRVDGRTPFRAVASNCTRSAPVVPSL